MATSLLNLYRHIAREFGYAQGQASSGSTTTIVDTNAGAAGGDISPFEDEDSDEMFANSWVLIEGISDVDAGSDDSTLTAPEGQTRRIRAYTPATGTITVRRAFSATVGSTHNYGIYMSVPPERFGVVKGLKDYINDILRETYYSTMALVSLAADADMEKSGVTDWTAGASGTLAKVTSLSNVGKNSIIPHGRRALRVTSPVGGNGYAGQAFDCIPTQKFLVSVDVTSSYGTTPSAATLGLWNSVSSAYFTTEAVGVVTGTSTAGQTRRLYALITIPASCYQFEVRLKADTASGVVYFDNLSVLDVTDPYGFGLLPPWFLERSWMTRAVQWLAPNSTASLGSSPQQGAIVKQHYLDPVPDLIGTTALRAKFWPMPANDTQLWVECIRPFDELSNVYDTTDCNKDLIRARALALIYDDKNDEKKAATWGEKALGLARSYDAMASKQQELTVKGNF